MSRTAKYSLKRALIAIAFPDLCGGGRDGRSRAEFELSENH
jgi:hypothetical protein